jgi:hypothetical protein
MLMRAAPRGIRRRTGDQYDARSGPSGRSEAMNTVLVARIADILPCEAAR